MDYRVDSGNRRSLIKEQHKSSHLEERMDSNAAASPEYDHQAVVKDVVSKPYCTRNWVETVGNTLDKAVSDTRSREELIKVGHLIKKEYPRSASDIFKKTGDEKGRKEMRERLFYSRDIGEQRYAYRMTISEGPESQKEYGQVLLQESSNPRLACYIFEELDELELLDQAIIQLEKEDPAAAKEFRKKAEKRKKDTGFFVLS